MLQVQPEAALIRCVKIKMVYIYYEVFLFFFCVVWVKFGPVSAEMKVAVNNLNSKFYPNQTETTRTTRSRFN